MRKELLILVVLVGIGLLIAGCAQQQPKATPTPVPAATPTPTPVTTSVAKYPSKSITYIIPFNPGGQSDIEARRQQPYLEKYLGVPIIITYKPGAGGAVAWAELTRTEPDGYTIYGINIPHIILQPLVKDVGYTTDQIKPVALFQRTPIGLAVPIDSPFNSVEDIIEYAKENPGKITVGGSGTYTGHHITLLQFEKLTGTKFTYVPFTGAAPQMQAILGGQVDAVFANSNDLVKYSGKQIKVLAIATEERFPTLPDVPTFKELGIDLVESIDRGVGVPKDTPDDIVKVLESAFLKITQNPDVRKTMEEEGFVPLSMGSKEAKAYINEKVKVYKEILKEVGALKS